MDFAFADTMEADRQDRACSLLISLSLLADTAKRRDACNGNSHVRLLYQRELHYHYERAIFDALRLLGVSIGNTEIASGTNVDRICDQGHQALMEILEKYEDYFDQEAE